MNILQMPKPAPTPRNYENWIEAFLDYCQWGEAPRRMYFWVGAAAVAGALERKVWIDQSYFRWYPNMYVVMVAPPGIVSKSTTANLATRLLRRVPDIAFGSTILTWQSLVKEFGENAKAFEYQDQLHPMSALMIESSELGNTINTQDKQLVDLLTSLWDGYSLQKSTKYGGKEQIENPCINLLGCTTPSWIADNFSSYMIGGGLMSRFIFIYADKKEKCIAYPGEDVPKNLKQLEDLLVADLTRISQLTGQFTFSKEALAYGREWYAVVNSTRPANLSDDRFSGYLARKQTHLHKLAMVLSAARGDSLQLEASDLANADLMLKDLEPDLAFVFAKAGRQELSHHVERLIQFVASKEKVRLIEAYQFIHPYAPKEEEFKSIIEGCLKAGWLRTEQGPQGIWLTVGIPLPSSTR